MRILFFTLLCEIFAGSPCYDACYTTSKSVGVKEDRLVFYIFYFDQLDQSYKIELQRYFISSWKCLTPTLSGFEINHWVQCVTQCQVDFCPNHVFDYRCKRCFDKCEKDRVRCINMCPTNPYLENFNTIFAITKWSNLTNCQVFSDFVSKIPK